MSTPPGYLRQQRPNRKSTPVIPSPEPERYEKEGAKEAKKWNCKEVSSVPTDRVREKPRKARSRWDGESQHREHTCYAVEDDGDDGNVIRENRLNCDDCRCMCVYMCVRVRVGIEMSGKGLNGRDA